MPAKPAHEFSQTVVRKRRCLADWLRHAATRMMNTQHALCDLALVPQDIQVTWLNRFRQLAVMPVLPKMVGGVLLESIKYK